MEQDLEAIKEDNVAASDYQSIFLAKQIPNFILSNKPQNQLRATCQLRGHFDAFLLAVDMVFEGAKKSAFETSAQPTSCVVKVRTV
jgi:hypothetical protein